MNVPELLDITDPKRFAVRLVEEAQSTAQALAERLHTTMMLSILRGRYDTRIRNVHSYTEITDIYDIPAGQALTYMRGKIPITAEEYEQTYAILKHYLFSSKTLRGVDRNMQWSILNTAQESLEGILQEGGTFRDFKRAMALSATDKMQSRLELIFNQNINNAYAYGNWREIYDPDLGNFDIVYLTMGDDRVRPEHAELQGFVAPKDDPIWEKIWPPVDYNCRCTVAAADGKDVEAWNTKFDEDPVRYNDIVSLVPEEFQGWPGRGFMAQQYYTETQAEQFISRMEGASTLRRTPEQVTKVEFWRAALEAREVLEGFHPEDVNALLVYHGSGWKPINEYLWGKAHAGEALATLRESELYAQEFRSMKAMTDALQKAYDHIGNVATVTGNVYNGKWFDTAAEANAFIDELRKNGSWTTRGYLSGSIVPEKSFAGEAGWLRLGSVGITEWDSSKLVAIKIIGQSGRPIPYSTLDEVVFTPNTKFRYKGTEQIGEITYHVLEEVPAATFAPDQKFAAISMFQEWDESQHPRVPAGVPEGGQFAPSDESWAHAEAKKWAKEHGEIEGGGAQIAAEARFLAARQREREMQAVKEAAATEAAKSSPVSARVGGDFVGQPELSGMPSGGRITDSPSELSEFQKAAEAATQEAEQASFDADMVRINAGLPEEVIAAMTDDQFAKITGMDKGETLAILQHERDTEAAAAQARENWERAISAEEEQARIEEREENEFSGTISERLRWVADRTNLQITTVAGTKDETPYWLTADGRAVNVGEGIHPVVAVQLGYGTAINSAMDNAYEDGLIRYRTIGEKGSGSYEAAFETTLGPEQLSVVDDMWSLHDYDKVYVENPFNKARYVEIEKDKWERYGRRVGPIYNRAIANEEEKGERGYIYSALHALHSKFEWDESKHPRHPEGAPDSAGGQFAPADGGTSGGAGARSGEAKVLRVYKGALDVDRATVSGFDQKIQAKIKAQASELGTEQEISDNYEKLMIDAQASGSFQEGKDWFDKEGQRAQEIAEEYGYDRATAAGALAAMSPGADWNQEIPIMTAMMDYEKNGTVNLDKAALAALNSRLADYGLKRVTNGTSFSDIKDSTAVVLAMRKQFMADGRGTWEVGYGYDNFAKAVDVLRGGDVNEVLSGPKVRSFYNNFMGDQDDVTIDVWMVQAAAADPTVQTSSVLTSPSVSRVGLGKTTIGAAPALSDIIRNLAKKYDVTPAQAEAIIWTEYRKQNPKATKGEATKLKRQS